MIAFNGQYLPAASHGNMRITAACLGGQWVIAPWLKTATQQAIIAAFGREEGIAVISRTNDYLNALALTDQTRAQQLAMFINEDPLLVCSLVETSKTRWLVGDGVAYINTNIAFGSAPYYELRMETIFRNNCTIIGAAVSDRYKLGIMPWDNTWWIGANNNESSCGTMSGLESAIVILTPTKFTDNGKTVSHSMNWSAEQNKLRIFGSVYGMSRNKIAYIKAEVAEFYPCLHNGIAGMLDIVSLTFYPNANTQGSFTIAITDKAT